MGIFYSIDSKAWFSIKLKVLSIILCCLKGDFALKWFSLIVKVGLFLSIVIVTNISAKGRPMPVCTNLRSLIIYDISKVMRSQCKQYGVSLEKSKIKIFFKAKLNQDPDLSPMACNMNCLKLKSFNNIDMKECVNNSLVKPFVKSFNQTMTYKKLTSKRACMAIRDMMDE